MCGECGGRGYSIGLSWFWFGCAVCGCGELEQQVCADCEPHTLAVWDDTWVRAPNLYARAALAKAVSGFRGVSPLCHWELSNRASSSTSPALHMVFSVRAHPS